MNAIEITCKTFDNTLSAEVLWKKVITRTLNTQNNKGGRSDRSLSADNPEKTRLKNNMSTAVMAFNTLKIIEVKR